MCKGKILSNKVTQDDLVRLAAEWRTAVVKEIGRDRYDQLSKSMGGDLAFAYVDHRVEQMMIDFMAKQEMPKSSVEYILRKGTEGSLLGLASTLSKSPLQEEIDRRGEAAYKPSLAERAGGRAVSLGSDIITTGGVSSWGSLAAYAGAETVFEGIDYVSDKRAETKSKYVELCISQGVFNSSKNVFDGFRSKQFTIVSYENKYVLSVNKNLKNKMLIMTEKPKNYLQADNKYDLPSPTKMMTDAAKPDIAKRDASIPLVVAPGHEQEYLDAQKKSVKTDTPIEAQTVSDETIQLDESIAETQPTNDDSWSKLLSSVGLNDMGSIGKNLPYVIAMLPDMLVGMFTGKTQSVGLKKDMIPIASILMGMFVDNPLLKMVLIGMGGANIVNKIGHEAIERQQPTQQYKQYADEELNPRITNPVIQGNTLVASIDNVPCSVTITENAAQAYASGALPLNTLANAVLAKYDQTYSVNNAQNIDMNSTVNRDRGITLR
jgi:hypothetical protein